MDICDDFLNVLPIEPAGMLLADDRLDFMDMDDVASIYSSELLDDIGYMSPMYSQQTGDLPPADERHHIPPHHGASIKTEPLSSYSSDESVDLNDLQTINPDDFLNDFFKSEVKSESSSSTSSSGRQLTPSPTSSSSSSSGHEYRIDMPNVYSATAAGAVLETPPLSPPSPDNGSTTSASTPVLASVLATTSTTTTPSSAQQIRVLNTISTSAAQIQYAQAIPIVQGTLIPISAVPLNIAHNASSPAANTPLPLNMKRIRIQSTNVAAPANATPPMHLNNAPQLPTTAPAPNNATYRKLPASATLLNQPKRIVFSAQDFNALVQKYRSQAPNNGKPITIKAAPATPIGTNGFQPIAVRPIRPVTTAVQLPQNPAVSSTSGPIQLVRKPQPQPLLLASSNQQQQLQLQQPSGQPVLRIAPAPMTTVTSTQRVLAPPLPPPAAALASLPRVAPKTQQTPQQTAYSTAAPPPPADKIEKKHQRMIKNRESACLSRKKKKDYMTALEQQIAELGDDNKALRTQNAFLRERCQHLEQRSLVCACGRQVAAAVAASVAPGAGGTGSMSSVRMLQRNKKNAVFLLAVVLVVSLNFAPLDNLLGGGLDAGRLQQIPTTNGGRHLLWVDDAPSNNRPSNDTRRQNYANPFGTDPYADHTDQPAPPPKSTPHYPMCPLHVNQTENVRLASELRRWIGDLPQYLNNGNNGTAAAAAASARDLDTISDYLFNDATIRTLFGQLHGAGQSADVAGGVRRGGMKAAALSSAVGHVKRPVMTTTTSTAASDPTSDAYNSDGETAANRLKLYDPIDHDALQYAELIEQLRRQPDTFYVVSFSGDHLLLPALAHNKTFRPKMSLMLPSSMGLKNASASRHDHGNEYVTLMQIDCEVVNTSLIQIKERLIPRHLRTKTATTTTTTATKQKTAYPQKTTTTTAKRRVAPNNNGLPLPLASKLRQQPSLRPSEVPSNVTHGAAFNATEMRPMYNVTGVKAAQRAQRAEDFAYTGQYRPYFVDKTRDRHRSAQFNAIP